MYPFLVEIGPVRVPSFGVMLTLGFLGSMFVLRRELRRQSFNPALTESLTLAAMAGGLVGAKLYFLIEAFSYVLQDPVRAIFSGSGFTFYGGLIGGAAGVGIVIRRHRLPAWRVIDAVALSLPVGYALGRIGCQLAGDGDYGMPTDLPWGMAYPDGLVPTLERVHPTPVYETLQSLAIFGILMKLRTRLLRPGQLFCVYLILTGLARFWVEFIRLNPRVLFGMTDAQLISILMVVGGGIWLFLAPHSALRTLQSRGGSHV